MTDPAVPVVAADHGIVEENVSVYPQSVMWQMVENFLAEGAAINVFARLNACHLHIVDADVKHDFGPHERSIDCKIAHGTRNFTREPAMTHEQVAVAIEYGTMLAGSMKGNVIGFGEIGIGNTTAAAAFMHKLTGIPQG